MRALAPVLLVGLLGAAPAEPADAPASPTTAPSDDGATTSGSSAIDTVLPSGVRVIAAQDLSLPVAAVVLAVETGTEDDPPELPGLVHALAYHLLQGNREHAPGGIARILHGGGGMTSLAIGSAQVRYESLVPASLLDEAIAAEASRLRAPTVSTSLWKDTLRAARRDRPRSGAVSPAVRAAAHQADRPPEATGKPDDALAGLGDRAISSQLAERFSYDRATLVVVSPEAPHLVLNRVLVGFADLPQVPRRARDRTAPVRTGSSPRTFELRGGKNALVWPIAADVSAQAWARTVCSALNHLRRAPEEPSRARLRCAIDDDPRRAVMVLRPSGTDDPLALARNRLARLREADAALLTTWRGNIAAQLDYELRTPLLLARHLARARVEARPAEQTSRPLAELLGKTALAEELAPPPAALPGVIAPLFEIGAATQLVEPSTTEGQRSTSNAQRSTLNAQRSTLDARRSTLNAQRSTLNARRSTLDASGGAAR